MPTLIRVAKDPDDSDDFVWDWADRLDTAETLSTQAVTVDAGSVVSSAIVGSTVVARISGGSDGSYINARCRITTSTGRQIDWTLQIPIKAQ